MIDQYEQAKNAKNAEVLKQFQRVHKIARRCFEVEETKSIIRAYIQKQKQSYVKKLFFGFFLPMVQYLEQMGTSNVIGVIISEFLPQLASTSALESIVPLSIGAKCDA